MRLSISSTDSWSFSSTSFCCVAAAVCSASLSVTGELGSAWSKRPVAEDGLKLVTMLNSGVVVTVTQSLRRCGLVIPCLAVDLVGRLFLLAGDSSASVGNVTSYKGKYWNDERGGGVDGSWTKIDLETAFRESLLLRSKCGAETTSSTPSNDFLQRFAASCESMATTDGSKTLLGEFLPNK